MKILPLAMMALFTTLSGAQEALSEIPSVSAEPLQKMKQLLPLLGAWDMTVSATEDNGKTWITYPTQKIKVTSKHKGMVIEESPEQLTSAGFHMLSYLSYDQYRKVFRKAAIDDVWGVMDIYEGNIEDEQLVLTNLKSSTFFPIENNGWRGFKLKIELKQQKRNMWIDKTDDNGATWQPAFKINYVHSFQ